MDDLLQRALERRAQLRAELEIVDQFIATYGEIKDRRPSDGPLFDEPQQPERRSRSEQSQAVDAMMKDAIDSILDEGRPLSRSELLQRLEGMGHAIEGGDKSKVLGTNLWRSRKFVNVKGQGYWPKGTPLPQRFASLPRRNSMLS